jgi:hypothetical protein
MITTDEVPALVAFCAQPAFIGTIEPPYTPKAALCRRFFVRHFAFALDRARENAEH